MKPFIKLNYCMQWGDFVLAYQRDAECPKPTFVIGMRQRDSLLGLRYGHLPVRKDVA